MEYKSYQGSNTHLNSSLPCGQVTIQILLVGELSRLPTFFQSQLINNSLTTKIDLQLFTVELHVGCNDLSDLLVIFSVLISFICCFLHYVLGVS